MLSFFRRKRAGADPKAILQDAVGDYELPSFPSAVLQTLRLLRDPGSSFQEIARTIEVNPGLMVKLLKMVNSAAFGLRRRVSNASHAVSLLGRSRLESLVIAMTVHGQLPTPTAEGFEAGRFWQAAARRAALARSLAEMLHPQTQSEAFVGGLLQDMAVPMLATARAKEYGPILRHWHETPGTSLEALERTELGCDHPGLGACMAARWELPDTLVTSIGGHHGEDDVEPAISLVGYVREGDTDPGLEPLVEACRASYGLEPDAVIARVDQAFEQARELASLFT